MPATVSLCDSTALATPPSPSSRPSTAAGPPGCAGRNLPRTLHTRPTTTAVRRLLLCRCVESEHRSLHCFTVPETTPSPRRFPQVDVLKGHIPIQGSFPFVCRSCCLSVRATGTVSCLSITCCLGKTPVRAPPSTSMWTTSVNRVSSAAAFSLLFLLPPPSVLLPPTPPDLYCLFFSLTQLNTRDTWPVRATPCCCAVSPPGC